MQLKRERKTKIVTYNLNEGRFNKKITGKKEEI